MKLPGASDTRLLVAGLVAFVGLMTYLAVAFANTHASNAAIPSKVAPFVPYHSHLARTSHPPEALVVRVSQAKPGNYGALVPMLVDHPTPGGKFVVGISLKGSSRGRVGVEVDEFAPGATSVYVVNTTVPVTQKWRHFTFSGRVKGSWLGLGMYVYRQTNRLAGTWFEVRRLTAALRGA